MADVVYLIRDMLFSSKLRETAKQLGVTIAAAPTPAALVEAARGARMMIVDLRLPGVMDAISALQAQKSDPAFANLGECIGFIDHEKTDVMDAAKAGGCTRVLTKGEFARKLPALLADLAPAKVPA